MVTLGLYVIKAEPKCRSMSVIRVIGLASSLEHDAESRAPKLQTALATEFFPWSGLGLFVVRSYVT